MSKLRSSGLVIAAGTYDGVLAGWEFKEKGLDLTFATAVHTGSIRSLSITSSPNGDEPGSLLSCGYDETLKTHDWHKRLTSSGEIRTPSDFGTPVCSSYAPPLEANSSHCVVGFSNGKICIYKKRDWSVQHVLAGHEGGVGDICVHPSGKLALSGGSSDGKLKLWDLTKGRLAFVNNISPSSTFGGQARFDPISSLVWSRDGEFYALGHGSHITVREVASGKELLDVDLPSRVNQVTLMAGEEGLFVVAACNDGSLPVLAVEDSDGDAESRRAIMAIEPVESHVAGVERFKCVVCVRDYYVVTSNSAGVVSVLNLEGAVKMMMSEEDELPSESENEDDDGGESDDDEAEVELAVEFLESIQLGTGARITCLTAWCRQGDVEEPETIDEVPKVEEESEKEVEHETRKEPLKRKQEDISGEMMDDKTMKKARSLVEKARNLKKKKDKKKKKSKPLS
jgi:WD40 repeat protein